MGGTINVIDPPTAPKTGSVPGERIEIIMDSHPSNGSGNFHYYSPDASGLAPFGIGGPITLKADCGDVSSLTNPNYTGYQYP